MNQIFQNSLCLVVLYLYFETHEFSNDEEEDGSHFYHDGAEEQEEQDYYENYYQDQDDDLEFENDVEICIQERSAGCCYVYLFYFIKFMGL